MCAVHDLSSLSSLTEASTLHLLRERFFRRHIYSYSGSTLISINPFRPLPHLYSSEVAKRYEAAATAAAADPAGAAAELDSLPPHLFRVADAAYRDMISNRRSQSIVIGGESGAGKTEALKYVLRYLTGLSNKAPAAPADGGEHAPVAQGEIELKLMDSNPLLESFGNCRTIRNNNSSRYGRYIRVHFNHDDPHSGGGAGAAGGIRNAEVAHYLLERSRVVHAAPNERSFHCLYQLVCGVADPAQREELHLPSSSAAALGQFHFLSRSGCTSVAGMDDAQEFGRTAAAMARLGITPQEQQAVWRILAAILQLGNVQLKARGAPDESARVAAAEHSDSSAAAAATTAGGSEAAFSAAGLTHLSNFASLLVLDGPSSSLAGAAAGGSPSALECAITTRVNYIRGEKFIVPYTVDQSLEARDGVAKEIYARLFDWMLGKVNLALRGSGSSSSAAEPAAGALSSPSSRDNDGFCIGILDIFGELGRKRAGHICIRLNRGRNTHSSILAIFCPRLSFFCFRLRALRAQLSGAAVH